MKERAREREKRERRRRRGSTDKNMENKRGKIEPNTIKCSAHKSNSKIEVTSAFYILFRAIRIYKRCLKIHLVTFKIATKVDVQIKCS